MILIYSIIAIMVIVLIVLYKHSVNKKKANQRIQAEQDAYTKTLDKYKIQIRHITSSILPFEESYCAWTILQNKITEIESQIPNITVPKRYAVDNELHHQYNQIRDFINNSKKLREKHNNAFVKKEAYRLQNYFRTVMSNPLDKQQIDAILHDDDNTLVIAGAGCGKTTTVEGKVAYLLSNDLAEPQELLLLSFAKKNADDLKRKLGHYGVECRTFHSLAYQIIKRSGDRAPDVILPEEASQIILDAHHALIRNATYLASFNDLILNGLRPIKNENDFKSYKDYINYLKDSEFESLKGMLDKKRARDKNNKKTLNAEFVKSAEECHIANFLYLNGVSYSYESPYLYQNEIDNNESYDKHKKKYRPDFTIYLNGYDEYSIKSCPNPADNLIYLEHYGIDEKGNTPKFFDAHDGLSARDYYHSIMKWKDGVHKRYKTKLIKSYSYEFKVKTLQENLINTLLKHGVNIVPKTNSEVYEILQNAYSKEIESVIKLINTFIGLLKSNNKDFASLYELNLSIFKQDSQMMERNMQFLTLIESIHEQYETKLKHLKKVDFNDLINFAKEKTELGLYQHQYKYVIVDEFQDISINRYDLLKALKDQLYCKVFAVGDDWQSIYRFTGSDLTLFKRFEQYFGHTITKKIETTYRFADPLINVSTNFILKNPNQTKKKLKPGKALKTDVVFEYNKKDDEPINIHLIAILQNLYLEYGDSLASKSITLLGRYNHDIDQVTEDAKVYVDKNKSGIQVKTQLTDIAVDKQGRVIRDNKLNLNKKIDFMTVHSAKGLESDIVILINCETGKYGFPAELSDDKILNLLLSNEDQYPNGEERRVFYVALTRAKEKFYFLANKNKQSKFVQEVFSAHVGYQKEALCCQKCEADLQFIKDIKGKFGLSKMFGCSNFKYGCDYTSFLKDKDYQSLLTT